MVRSGRRHLLAVDDAQPLGIVPASDLVALLAR
jgi:hypothetical protein